MGKSGSGSGSGCDSRCVAASAEELGWCGLGKQGELVGALVTRETRVFHFCAVAEQTLITGGIDRHLQVCHAVV